MTNYRAAFPGRPVPSGICYIDFDNIDRAMITAGAKAVEDLRALIRADLCDRFGADNIAELARSQAIMLYLQGQDRVALIAQVEAALELVPTRRLDLEYGGCSICARAGVSWYEEGLDHSLLIRQAHAAALTARVNRQRVAIFDAQGEQTVVEARLIGDLTTAMDEGRLRLMAQEIRRLRGDESGLRQYEVLVQMTDRFGVDHPPSSFVPLAERSELIEVLDHWIFRHAVVDHADALRAGADITLSINVSGRSLSSAAFGAMLRATLSESGIDPVRIQLEITETSEIHNMDQAVENVRLARDAGMAVALDDFGAGLSGYMYLKHLDVTCLKIDGALIPNVVQNFSLETKIVRSVVALAHHLELEVVAEHVSSPEIMAALRQLGVDKVQGYEVSVPFPYSELFAKAT